MTDKYRIPDLPAWEQPDNVVDFYVEKLGRIWAWLVVAIALISFYEVVARYLFNAPTIWVHETAIMFAGLCFAFGGPYAMARHRHIRVTGLYNLFGFKTRCFLDILICLITLAFAAGNAWAFLRFANKAFFAPDGTFRLEGSGTAFNPPYPPLVKGVFLFVMIVLVVQVLLRLKAAIQGLVQGEKEKSA